MADKMTTQEQAKIEQALSKVLAGYELETSLAILRFLYESGASLTDARKALNMAQTAAYLLGDWPDLFGG